MMQNLLTETRKVLFASLPVFFLLASVTHAQQAMTVSVVDNAYQPQSTDVPAGATVTWMNTGAMQHTVTADDGSFDSGMLSPGASFSHTFTTPGTYRYYCRFHGAPGGVGMSGTITVTGTSGAAQGQQAPTQPMQYGMPTQYQYPSQYGAGYPQQTYPTQYSQSPQQSPTQQYMPLSNVPYTGFDFGTWGDAVYWFGISMFGIAVAYLLYHSIRRATK